MDMGLFHYMNAYIYSYRIRPTVTADNLDTSPSVAGLNSVMHYVCVHRVHTVNNWSNDWLMYADDSSYMLLRGHVIII